MEVVLKFLVVNAEFQNSELAGRERCVVEGWGGCLDLGGGFRIVRAMVEKHWRSFAKAVSWRVTGSIDTMVITYIITRQWKWAFSIMSVEFFTNITIFFFHERIWHILPLGRLKPPKYKANFEI